MGAVPRCEYVPAMLLFLLFFVVDADLIASSSHDLQIKPVFASRMDAHGSPASVTCQ